MSEQPQQEPQQNLDISASLENVQIGGIAGRDLNVTQIQGQVVYATVYDRIHAPDGLSGQPVSSIKPFTQNEYRQRKVLLNKVKKFWIESVLEQSLHNHVLIELGLEEKPHATSAPFLGVKEFIEQPEENRSINASVTEIFEQMGSGRTLLILGDPGSGKTITLLRLAQSLIEKTEQDLRQPIPVVFNLSSWAIKQPKIKEWLIEQLFDNYRVSKPLGKTWIEEEQLILFLDGLDEVKAKCRNDCIRELNQFTKSHGITEMVMCCRIQDYEACEEKLNLQSAICIQALTQSQIFQYVNQGGKQLIALKTLLQQNEELQKLATSPLILSVMSLAYQDCSLEELSVFGSTKEWQQRLFDNYIERMFQRRRITQLYPEKTTKGWLTWLAQRMVKEYNTIFLIEEMQISWLQTVVQKRNYRIVSRIILALIWGSLHIGLLATYHLNHAVGGLVYGLIYGLIGSIFYGLIGGFVSELTHGIFSRLLDGIILAIIYGVIFGLVFGKIFDWQYGQYYGLLYTLVYAINGAVIYGPLSREIQAVDEMKWSWLKVKSNMLLGLGLFLVLLIVGKLELTSSLIYGLMVLLVFGFEKKYIVTKRSLPNQGIRNSLVNAGILFVVIGLPSGLLLGLVENPLSGLVNGTLLGLALSLAGGQASGITCLKHLTLRLILWHNHYIPWNYARFLDYATERIFLRKVGGSYIFIHRMLMEHFAQMESEPGQR